MDVEYQYFFSADEEVPSESQCRPYIEKALKELESGAEPGEYTSIFFIVPLMPQTD